MRTPFLAFKSTCAIEGRRLQLPPDVLRPAAALPVAPALLATAAARAGDMCKRALHAGFA